MVISRVVYKQYLLVGQIKSGNKREGYVVVDTSYNKVYIMSAKDVIAYAKANMIRYCVCQGDELVCRLTDGERELVLQSMNQAIGSEQMDFSSFEGDFLRTLTAFSMSHVQYMKQRGGACISMDNLFGQTGLVMYKAIVPHQYAYFIAELQKIGANFIEMYDMPNDGAQMYTFMLPMSSTKMMADIMSNSPIFCNFTGVNRVAKLNHNPELIRSMRYLVGVNDKNEKKAGLDQSNGTNKPANAGVVTNKRQITGVHQMAGRM